MRLETRLMFGLVCSASLLAAGCPKKEAEPAPGPQRVERAADYIDPFIATNGFGFRIASGFPGPAAPNGLVKVSPDTSGPYGVVPFLHYSGYWYGDDKIQGFSHLHLHGTGLADLGVISFMPTEAFDRSRRQAPGYQSSFDKDSERASAGYYAVTLDRGDIEVELTATTRTAHHRYSFPPDASEGFVIIDLAKVLYNGRVEDAVLEIDAENRRIRGAIQNLGQMSRRFGGSRIFFEIRSLGPWADSSVWADGSEPEPGTSVAGDSIGAVLRFPLTGDPIELQVGISLVDADGAAANLAEEQPAWDFDATRAATEEAWNDMVSVVRIHGGSERERRIFYTGLYHAFLMPTTYSDVDGRYTGQDGNIHTAADFRYMSDLSLWDTYRTVHPLYALIAPREARDSVMSLHAMARHSNNGFPRWPLATGETGVMLGAPADIVIADAYVKGITDFDIDDVWIRLRAAAMEKETPPTGRGSREGTEDYIDLHYQPLGRGRPVSTTIEYNHADFALAQLASALGEIEDAELLLERRRGWRKLYDPQTGFLWAHDAEGVLRDGEKDPLFWYSEEFAEANAWQSLFGPQHDVEGLVELMGGREAFIERLSFFFEEAKSLRDAVDPEDELGMALPFSYYEHGNEPSIHIAYLFAQAGRPSLTQKWVRWVMENDYDDAPYGLAGNDDGGTLSSWYVFSALGLYPIAGSDRYVVGAPLFPVAEIHVPGGVFTVEAESAGGDHIFVQSVTLDGAPLEVAEIRHADLRAGGSLRFVLGPQPSSWGEP